MLYYFPWQNQQYRIYKCKLSEHSDLDKIREWAISHSFAHYTRFARCTSWRYDMLPADISLLYYTIATNKNIIKMFQDNFGKNYYIDIINDMNEICLTPPCVNNDKNNTRSIDGPYYLFPFASCYCIIIGLDDNCNVVTRFTMTPQDNIVKKGDVLAFDYHRESHYMYNKYSNSNLQVVLKIHYCVYPRSAYYFGKALGLLSAYYNNASIRLNTKIIHDIEYYIGFNNISFLLLLFYISKITHYNIFLFGCSAIYYFRKINRVPDNCNVCILKRDLGFYYTVYSLQIYYMYVKNLFTSLYISYFTSIIFFTFLYYDLKYLHTIFR